MYYIAVCEYEDSETIEIPVEEDDTVLLTTLGGIFPNVCGLKYRPLETNTTFRALKLSDGKFYKPVEGWEDLKFYCVFPKADSNSNNKRKNDEEIEKPLQKSKRLEGSGGNRKCTDLIVLNLGWKVDEEMLRKYFSSKFGELVLVQVKKDRETNHSKGYAFIRFAEYAGQVLCLAEKHLIDGRWCAVKVPFSKNEADKQEISKKIHVGYASEDISMEDLRIAFEQYGYVTDIFIPKPFRNFAFVTFDSSDTAQSLIGQSINVNGHTLTIGSAVPKINSNRKSGGGGGGFGGPAHYPMYGDNMQAQGYQTRYAPGMIPTYGAAWPPSYDMAAAQKAAARMNSSSNNASGGYPGGAAAAAAAAAYQGLLTGQTYVMSNNGSHHHHQHHRAGGQEAMQQGGGYVGGGGGGQDMMHQNYMSNQYGGAGDASQHGSAANAALNILNNPEVVAAIVAAANKAGSNAMLSGAGGGGGGKYKK